jgi:predicted  nucleic acid-binding Zn-ribbon protein
MNDMIGFTANGETDTVIKYVDAKVAEAAKGATGELTEAVNGLDKKITDLTDDLNDEIERAGVAEKANSDAIAAQKARIDKLYAGSIEVDGEVIPDEGKSVRAIAAEEVALIVDGASESYDTLKEIADWIAAHPTDASEYNSRITKNTEDIAALTKTVGDNKTAANEAIEALKGRATDLEGRATAVEGRATALETRAKSAEDRLAELEAHDEDYKGYTDNAIAALDSSFEAKTTAEGKVAVVTGIEIADGKIVAEGEGKKTAKVDVYTVEKIDALFDAAIGDGGSVNDQITDALDELDFAGATVTPAKAGTSVIANVTQENGKITATAVEVEAAGAAAAAEKAAKEYVDGKDSAMNTRVAALEAVKDDYKGADATLKSDLEGQIAAAEAAAKKHTNDIVGELPKVEDQTQTVAQAIAAAEAAAKAYADQKVSGKNVTASGDDYVAAVAEGNHVTVTTNTSAIRDRIFVWDGFGEE